MSLLDKMRESFVYQAVKHELCKPGESPEEFADRQINQMTNAELVAAISEALEELL